MNGSARSTGILDRVDDSPDSLLPTVLLDGRSTNVLREPHESLPRIGFVSV
jgi:hypothetical protein